MTPAPTSVVVSAGAATAIRTETARAAAGLETGGLLLGRRSGNDLLVTAAGDPGPNAEHSPRRFRRDLIHAQRLADEAWARDGSEWIGEWHTHPRGPQHPSPFDAAVYRTFLDDPELGFAHVLAVVVAPEPFTVTMWLVSAEERATLVTPITHVVVEENGTLL